MMFVPPQLVLRRATLSEDRGVVGRELASPAAVPVKSTAEEEDACEREDWLASMQFRKEDL